jgi:hypothetical protein
MDASIDQARLAEAMDWLIDGCASAPKGVSVPQLVDGVA